MRKAVSYFFLLVTAVVGLSSIVGIRSATDVIAKANDDMAKQDAESAKRAREIDEEIAMAHDGAIDPEPRDEDELNEIDSGFADSTED